MNLYSHQEYKDGMYYNKFIFVHDDTFARAFESIDDLVKHFYGTEGVTISPISKYGKGINIFGLQVATDSPIEDIGSLEKLDYAFQSLSDIKYYDGTPCDFNPPNNSL